jgi:hypothetical protein
MSTRNDGTKLRQYWIVLNFVDLSSLANQAEDLKTSVRINRETRKYCVKSSAVSVINVIIIVAVIFNQFVFRHQLLKLGLLHLSTMK